MTRGQSDARVLLRGVSVSLPGALVGRVLHVAVQVGVARLLGVVGFGLYALGWTVVRMLLLIGPLGMDKGVIRFGSMARDGRAGGQQTVVYRAILLGFGGGALLAGMLYVSSPLMARLVFKEPELIPVMRLFAPVVFLGSGLRVLAEATKLSGRVDYWVKAELLTQPFCALVFVLAIWPLGWGVAGAVMATVLSYGVAVVLAGAYMGRVRKSLVADRYRRGWSVSELLQFSVPASLAGTFTMAIIWVDRLIIGFYRPTGDVGIYQAASQVALILTLILGGFGAVVGPMVAELYSRGERDRLARLFTVSTRWGTYLSLPVFLTLFLRPGDVLRVIFGEGYSLGTAALLILAMGQFVNVGTGQVGHVLVMTGHQRRWFRIAGAMLCANVGLSLLLVPRLGIVGAAVSTAAAVTIMFGWGLAEVRHRLGLWPYDGSYLKAGAAALAGAVGGWFAGWLGPPGFGGVVLVAVVVTGAFVSVLAALGIDREEAALLRDVFRARFTKARANASC